jgi:hypothetical protein
MSMFLSDPLYTSYESQSTLVNNGGWVKIEHNFVTWMNSVHRLECKRRMTLMHHTPLERQVSTFASNSL